MKGTITERILREHLIEGTLKPGEEIGLTIDQTLTQDATGTMVYLEFESLGIERVKPEVAVSYIDHNIIQSDFKNADDHRFLQSSASKYGVKLSPPGNGVSHHVHRQRFGVPEKTLLGSDSHTTVGGCLGMLAMGAGGIEVAMAMAGKPYYINTPEVWGCYLEGELPPWVVGKDLILHLLGKYSVKGGIGKIMEFFGPGVTSLKMPDRAMIANMSVDMGLTAGIFPSDEVTKEYLALNGRENAWHELSTEKNAQFDLTTEIDLSTLEPLVACPHSPDNVKPAAELGDVELDQVIIGSSASGGYRDIMVAAEVLDGKYRNLTTDFDINPPSRQDLENAVEMGGIQKLIGSGARICEAGCLGCIGMGQAPATGGTSMRTFPRNFKGRSGTVDANVYLASAETAAASVLHGRITDPRTLGDPPGVEYPKKFSFNPVWIIEPAEDPATVEIKRGPNIKPFPNFGPLEDSLEGEVVLKVEDNITTDHIMPAGTRVLPYRSNIPKISEFVYDVVDKTFAERAKKIKNGIIIGGENYGQGSSREHAALAPRYLGIRVKIAKSFARIHKSNLINFGIIPLEFADPADYEKIHQGDTVIVATIKKLIEDGAQEVPVTVGDKEIKTVLTVSERHRDMLIKGGLLNQARE
jgi:aconitate hydratase